MKKRIVIVGNGTLSKKYLTLIQPQDYVIGVDRAAYWLIRQGRIPDIAIGDFDSVTKKELKLIKKFTRFVKQYPGEKNRTDMELAIRYAASLAPAEVFIFGATGTRLDHMLATLHLLDKHILIDKNNRVRLVGRGKTTIEKASYRYISILPYTKSITLSLTGFRYDLVRKTLKQGTTLGVSNEIQKAEGTIRMFSGKAWVIENND
jgi:thiamine pyrophosphokinase